MHIGCAPTIYIVYSDLRRAVKGAGVQSSRLAELGEPSYQVLHRAIPLDTVARATQQLQVVDMVGAASALRYHVVHLERAINLTAIIQR